MNRTEFLKELDRGLSGISYDEKKEILSDYEEHFRIGLAEGKGEDEISAALGQPRTIAKAYLADYLVKQAHTNKSARNIVRAVLAVISLSFFNLVVVLGPFLGLVGGLIGLWAGGVTVVIVGLAVFLAAIVHPIIRFPIAIYDPLGMLGAALIGVGLTSLGLLACIGLFKLTVWFYKAMVGYLGFNLRIIRGEEGQS